jgi:hypothetical protein
MPSAFDGYLPNGWDDCSGCKKPARLNANGHCAKCAEDLQLWLRHGRIGTGRGYEAEVERARQIEASLELPSHDRGTENV